MPISQPQPYYHGIDVIRGIAILLVVLYHLRLLEAGFVGVDIFFVISGYLITATLASQRISGFGAFAEFIVRRCRRLLPALTVTVVTVCMASLWILNPFQPLASLGGHALATAAFANNIYLWRNAGDYFAPAQESLPLLHLWSLSVEWQFYFIWGAILCGMLSSGRLRNSTKIQASGILLGGLVSFLLAWWALDHRPIPGFYLLPTRVWEFFLGAGLALWLASRNSKFRPNRFVLLAISLLFALLLTNRHLFSVFAAQVVGATWALAAVAFSTTLNNITKPLKILGLFGLISYSWYLWHWPTLSLLRSYRMLDTTLGEEILAVSFSFMASILTYRFIENPFREKGVVTRSHNYTKGFFSFAAALAGIALLGIALSKYSEGLAKDNPRNLGLIVESHDFESTNCQRQFSGTTCEYGDQGSVRKVRFWGDSHAGHFAPMAQKIAEEAQAFVILNTRGGCAPLSRLPPISVNLDSCSEFNDSVLKDIKSSAEKGEQWTIALAARWPLHFGRLPLSFADKKTLIANEPPVSRFSKDATRTGLELTAARLQELGVRTILITAVPELPYAAPECLWRNSKNRDRCMVSKDTHLEYNKVVHDEFKLLAQRKLVEIYDVTNFFCIDGLKCLVETAGRSLYSDDDHLSKYGALQFWGAESHSILKALFASGP